MVIPIPLLNKILKILKEVLDMANQYSHPKRHFIKEVYTELYNFLQK